VTAPARRPQPELKPGPSALARGFAASADRVAHWIGQPHTFIILCVGMALWAFAIFVLRIPDGWALSLNAITIVTFLMVFLIQSTQNRSGAAIQAKLDELIRAHAPAENKFMGIEKLTIEEVHELRNEGQVEGDTGAAATRSRPGKSERGS
jgi:low affinity Fe/Cu permease